jgi:DNA-binding CsgD family transcriptional regulator
MDTRISDFVLSLYRASRTLSHAEFRTWVFAAVGKYLDFDSGFWLRTTIAPDGPVLHDQHLDRQLPDRLTGYLLDGLWQEDPFLRRALDRRGAAENLAASEVPSPRLRAFLARHRQAHVVAWIEADPDSGIFLGWSLFRADAARPFEESDRLFVEVVGPLVTDAWNQSWMRQLEAVSPRAKRLGYVQAILTDAGILTVVDDRFASDLRVEWPDWQGPLLPAELREHLQLRSHEPYRGRHVVVRFQQLPDRLVRLQLRSAHALDQLPRRKLEVARLFAAGESQAAIAERLALSPSTVNNYLGDIYRELEVSDKAQLANLVARLPE